jgi:hypothetical protein
VIIPLSNKISLCRVHLKCRSFPILRVYEGIVEMTSRIEVQMMQFHFKPSFMKQVSNMKSNVGVLKFAIDRTDFDFQCGLFGHFTHWRTLTAAGRLFLWMIVAHLQAAKRGRANVLCSSLIRQICSSSSQRLYFWGIHFENLELILFRYIELT